MSLLREIQSNLLDPDVSLSVILLRLQFLASRLGSGVLADWVQHESEGYPQSVSVPEYRIVTVAYTGTFLGAFGTGVKNAQIPPYIIQKFSDESWVKYSMRSSIAAMQELVKNDSGHIGIDASNLILMLGDNVYQDLNCVDVRGTIARNSIVQILQNVRSRVLSFTTTLESELPEAREVKLESTPGVTVDKNTVSQVFNQVILGGVVQIAKDGSNSSAINIVPGEIVSIKHSLVNSGMEAAAAEEVSSIIATERPESIEAPLGEKTKKWITENYGKLRGAVGKMTLTTLEKLLAEVALRYFGLK